MTGFLSLGREVIEVFAPNRIPQSELFWVSTRIAFVLAMVAVWWREHSALKVETKKRLAAEGTIGRPHITLSYSKPESQEPKLDGSVIERRRESEFVVRNASPDKDAFEIDLLEFNLASFTIVGRSISQLQAGASERIGYYVGVFDPNGILHGAIEYDHNLLPLLDKEFESTKKAGHLPVPTSAPFIPMVIRYKNADGVRFETKFKLQYFPPSTNLQPRVYLLDSKRISE